MRWLQTSDVHLRSDRPERRRALELVFGAVTAHAADALLIAGDLFDRSSDAVGERAAVRELIESVAPRPVILVPGNHDADAYGEGTDFGANAVVLARAPHQRANACGAELIGVPYQQGRTIAECLTGVVCEPRHTVLVAHATLADGIPGGFAGDGEDGAYMPIHLSDVLRRFAYVALGHIHSGRNLVRRDGERLVAYAGSPVATSRREIGPRAVLAVDFEPGVGVLAHHVIPLDVPWYERTEVACSPGREEEAIESLARQAAQLRRPGVRVLARLSGVSTVAESALREAATRAIGRACGQAGDPVGHPSTDSTASGPSGSPDDTAADGAGAGAPLPRLELQVTSYAALAQIPVVSEFVNRLQSCARAEEAEDPRLLEAALRIGLGAFLESLP